MHLFLSYLTYLLNFKFNNVLKFIILMSPNVELPNIATLHLHKLLKYINLNEKMHKHNKHNN